MRQIKQRNIFVKRSNIYKKRYKSNKIDNYSSCYNEQYINCKHQRTWEGGQRLISNLKHLGIYDLSMLVSQ